MLNIFSDLRAQLLYSVFKRNESVFVGPRCWGRRLRRPVRTYLAAPTVTPEAAAGVEPGLKAIHRTDSSFVP